MPSRSVASSFISGLLVLALASCSSTPRPVATPAPPAAVEAPPSSINLLCHEGARAVRFDKMGVPVEERAADVALTRGSAWVLFTQGRLVQLSRGGDTMSVQTRLLPGGKRWNRLAVDPVDDSLWAVSQDLFDLYRISPEGQVSVIKLQRKIEGTGGFYNLVVGRDAIYAQPICADTAVWRIDRAGKVLGTAFEASQQTEAVRATEGADARRGCANVFLEKDAEGRILVWDEVQKATQQVDEQGNWTPSDSRLLTQLGESSPAVAIQGEMREERTDQWYFTDVVGDLFYWKGQPVFLKGWSSRERRTQGYTVLLLPGDGEAREVLMSCNGFPIRHVTTDATGYAAISERFLVFGEMAGAPDLP